eukprot:TRINITY_DN8421_c0_g1_i2.p1 TRINITY_DN8421_c0_g1~~TRINITY_DN8421_c0_g1_i2.p1  ORF type:complete len:171 (-),score=30.81 TRINITY_DN8421_c0_g1_i2:193-705(-)
MEFLTWLYQYASKFGPTNNVHYNAYERRVEAMLKQRNPPENMNSYLVPNKAFLKLKQKKIGNEGVKRGSPMRDDLADFYQMKAGHSDHMGRQNFFDDIEDFIDLMEQNIKNKMESNWKMLHRVEEICLERNFYYDLLRQIEDTCVASPESEIQQGFLDIIRLEPEDFKQV